MKSESKIKVYRIDLGKTEEFWFCSVKRTANEMALHAILDKASNVNAVLKALTILDRNIYVSFLEV